MAGDGEAAGFKWLLKRLERRKTKAYADAEDCVGSDFARLEGPLRERLSEYLRHVDPGGAVQHETFKDVSGRLLREHAAELVALLAAIRSEGDEAAQHEARISAKRLRYLLEPFAGLVEGAVALVGDIKLLQGPFLLFPLPFTGDSKTEWGINAELEWGGLAMFAQYVDQEIANLPRSGGELEVAYRFEMPGMLVSDTPVFRWLQPVIRYSTIDNDFELGQGQWRRSSGRGHDAGHSATHSLYYGAGEGEDGGRGSGGHRGPHFGCPRGPEIIGRHPPRDPRAACYDPAHHDGSRFRTRTRAEGRPRA